MKKVFLSLAVIAVLTAVSCKKAEAVAEEVAVDSTAVEAPAVDSAVATAEYLANITSLQCTNINGDLDLSNIPNGTMVLVVKLMSYLR